MTTIFKKRGCPMAAVMIPLFATVLLACNQSAPVPALTLITVSPACFILTGATGQQLVAIGRYSDNTEKDITAVVAWISSDATVATITPEGVVNSAVPYKTGVVDITATLSGMAGHTSLTVSDPELTSISITPAEATILNGSEQQFTAIGRYSNKAEQNITSQVTWSSSDTSVASITSTGLVQAGAAQNIGEYTADISASMAAITGIASLTVVELGNNPPRVQVVNTSIWNVYQVKVGPILFPELLCSGCSTLYSDVLAGTNDIFAYWNPSLDWEEQFGLGPFLEGNHYTVEVWNPAYWSCVKLWQRLQPDTDFVNDSTKVFIGSSGCDRGV